MAAVIFLMSCVLTLTAAQQGLPCMRKDVIQTTIRKCFKDLGGGNLISLDPTDRSGPMGQVSKLLREKEVCRPDRLKHVVDGFGCYTDFYGKCLRMTNLLPGPSEIGDAFGYACKHTKDLKHTCLKDVPEHMMECYLEKVKERQLDLLRGKVHMKSVEDETCRFMREEMKCLKTALHKCPSTVSTVYYTFMGKMIPRICRHSDLREVLRQSLRKKQGRQPTYDMKLGRDPR